MAEEDDAIHRALSDWIVRNGGTIHPNLALRTPPATSVDDDGDAATTTTTTTTTNDRRPRGMRYSRRGIFAERGPISEGEVLVRLPRHLALDGGALPSRRRRRAGASSGPTTEEVVASPWLRCLASLVIAQLRRRARPGVDDRDSDDRGSDDGPPSSRSRGVCHDPYLASLPDEYDSLLNWSGGEVRCFLAGTALGEMASTDAGGGPALRERFLGVVVPYLAFLEDEGLLPREGGAGYVPPPPPRREEYPKRRRTGGGGGGGGATRSSANGADADRLYPLFLEGCMCISTRAFHMRPSPTPADDRRDDDAGRDEAYPGPYLLPYVDLLNHSPRGERATTLRRDDADGSFVMVAERDVAAGEEIRHSYHDSPGTAATDDDDRGGTEGPRMTSNDVPSGCGSSLNSAQSLRTFGFVDVEGSVRNLSESYHRRTTGEIVVRGDDIIPPALVYNLTPAVLSKKGICRCCELLATSSYPDTLRRFMDESGLSDEGWEHWEMPTSEEIRSRNDLLTSISDEFVVPFPGTPPSDELITVCCLHFLPRDAIDELLEESTTDDGRSDGSQQPRNLLFGNEALEDHFLGKLVLRAIANALDDKLNLYKVSSSDFLLGCSGQHDQARQFLDLLGSFYLSEYRSGMTFRWGESVIKDASLLLKVKPFRDGRHSDLVQKFSYGMVVSLEERACLLDFKRYTLEMIWQLDRGDKR